jgi:uncharacterized damage-inducible protein DinB
LQETQRLEDQLNRSFRGEAWHGPSLEELLHDLAYEGAAARPLPNVHSIWEIVLHLTAWLDAVRRGAEGERVELSPAQDWPAAPEASDAQWQVALGNLESAHEKLRGTILALDPTRLDHRVPGKPYSIYFMLQGAIQHNVYHAGQVALLKKS